MPPSSTATYDHLLKLIDCDDFEIKNVTFDGKYEAGSTGYENGFMDLSGVADDDTEGTVGGDGCLLIVDDCGGTNTLTGVHVANNRGKWASKQQPENTWNKLETFKALAVYMKKCGTVNLTNCTGSRTGYNTWRTAGTDVANYTNCRGENVHHRILGEGTTGSLAVTSLTFLNCNFIQDEARHTDGSAMGIREDLAYSTIGNLNTKANQNMSTSRFEDCYADWRFAESTMTEKNQGISYSWNYTGPDNSLLLKIEGIDDAKFINCDFLHGKNEGGGNAATLKTDSSRVVKDLTLEECKFSGALIMNPSFSPSSLGSLKILGTHLQADGRFGQNAAIWGIQYPTLVINSFNGTSPKIDNISSGVIRMGEDDFDEFPSTKTWTCTDLIANGESTSVTARFVTHYWENNPDGQNFGAPPKIGDMDQSTTGFQNENTFQDALSFTFSKSDIPDEVSILD